MDTARELYDLIVPIEEDLEKDMGEFGVTYIWRKGGFQIRRAECWEKLNEADEFMERVVRTCPYELRFDLFWYRKRLGLYLDHQALYLMKYGTTEKELERIVERAEADRQLKAEAIKNDGWMIEAEEDVVIDAVRDLIRTTARMIGDYRREVSDRLIERLALLGFTVVCDDDEDTLRWLVPVE